MYRMNKKLCYIYVVAFHKLRFRYFICDNVVSDQKKLRKSSYQLHCSS